MIKRSYARPESFESDKEKFENSRPPSCDTVVVVVAVDFAIADLCSEQHYN